MEALLSSLLTGGMALLGTIITVKASQRKTESMMQTEMAVMKSEIKSLRKEVEKHNNFAERVPKLEVLEKANENAIRRLENFHME